MGAFTTPVDIGNRALQHCGSPRMDPLVGFQENSKAASEISFCYDKLREAELQRRVWTFATRRTILRAIDANTMRLLPALWVQSTTYFVGSIVADQNGNNWISRIPNNAGNQPLTSTTWEPYFGPLSVSLYDSSTAYITGEVVYTAPGDGTYRVFQSLQSGNSDDPTVATAFDATAVYSKNKVVTSASIAYMSLIDLNTGNTPALSPAPWSNLTIYAAAAAVAGSDGVKYTSIGSGNVGHDPTLDGGLNWTSTGVLVPWTTVFVGGSGSAKWLQIGGAAFPSGVGLTTLNITYPQGAGPSAQSTTSNVFLLPSGFLRLAPQNPHPGINNLGGPSGSWYYDWLIEGEYLISSDVGPIPLRFVADVTDVRRMHSMFCEGLAARVGLEVCEPITQSNVQIGVIAKIYDKWISEAGMIDAIEDGYTDPPEDELISVRW